MFDSHLIDRVDGVVATGPNARVENLWMFGEKPVDEKTGRFFLRPETL